MFLTTQLEEEVDKNIFRFFSLSILFICGLLFRNTPSWTDGFFTIFFFLTPLLGVIIFTYIEKSEIKNYFREKNPEKSFQRRVEKRRIRKTRKLLRKQKSRASSTPIERNINYLSESIKKLQSSQYQKNSDFFIFYGEYLGHLFNSISSMAWGNKKSSEEILDALFQDKWTKTYIRKLKSSSPIISAEERREKIREAFLSSVKVRTDQRESLEGLFVQKISNL